jgi:hypothetical protein
MASLPASSRDISCCHDSARHAPASLHHKTVCTGGTAIYLFKYLLRNHPLSYEIMPNIKRMSKDDLEEKKTLISAFLEVG